MPEFQCGSGQHSKLFIGLIAFSTSTVYATPCQLVTRFSHSQFIFHICVHLSNNVFFLFILDSMEIVLFKFSLFQRITNLVHFCVVLKIYIAFVFSLHNVPFVTILIKIQAPQKFVGIRKQVRKLKFFQGMPFMLMFSF